MDKATATDTAARMVALAAELLDSATALLDDTEPAPTPPPTPKPNTEATR